MTEQTVQLIITLKVKENDQSFERPGQLHLIFQ